MANNGFEELMQAWFSETVHNERKAEWDIQAIAHVLESAPNVSWSRIPRIYSILRIINQLSVIDCFLVEGVSDVGFPFTSRSLPTSLRDTTIRSAFLSAQDLVFNTKAQDLERERTRHSHFRDPADIPLKKIEELGKGAYGFVDRVVSTISHKEYARKLIPRGKTFKRDREVLRDFERELASLKKISTHKHIVQLVASYTEPRYVGILTSPVADRNLHEYLQQQLDSGKRSFLRGFFGCLTSAVCFLHDNQVRHKDIKPQNVLVKGDCVFLTDFGLALDWSERSKSVTTGPSTSTPRYGAPEVVSHAPRSSPADLWSLGCVFLEIWTLSRGESKQSLELHLESTGSRSSSYCLNLAGVDTWIESIVKRPGSAADNAPVVWIKNMLQQDQAARWTAHELDESIQAHDEDPATPFAFTGRCCSHDEDTAESVYSTCDEDVEDTAAVSKTPKSNRRSEAGWNAKERRVTTGPTGGLPVSLPDASPAFPSSHSSTRAPDSLSQQHKTSDSNRKSMHTPPGNGTASDTSGTPRASAQMPKKNTTHKFISVSSPSQAHVEDESVSLACETGGVPRTPADIRVEASAKEVNAHPPTLLFGKYVAPGLKVRSARDANQKVRLHSPSRPPDNRTVSLPAHNVGHHYVTPPGEIRMRREMRKDEAKVEKPAEAELRRKEEEKAEFERSKELKARSERIEEEEKATRWVEIERFRQRVEAKAEYLRWEAQQGGSKNINEEETKRLQEEQAELGRRRAEAYAEFRRRAEARNENEHTKQTEREKTERVRPDTAHSNIEQCAFCSCLLGSSGTNRKCPCKDCSDPKGKASLSCGHIICRPCLRRKIKFSVRLPQYRPLKCCDTEIVLDSGLIALHLEPDLVLKWSEKYTDYKSISEKFDELICPRTDCKERFVPSKIRVDRGSRKKFVRCVHCSVAVCPDCGLEFHARSQCNEPALRRRQ